MNKMTLLETLNQHTNKGLMVKLRYDDSLKLDIINNTQFLPDESSLSERIYCIKHSIAEQLYCPICNKPRKFRSTNIGYFATCGDKACQQTAQRQNVVISNKSRDYSETVKKAKATYKARTGYEHNMQNPAFKEQFFNSLEEKTGVRYPIASEKSKQHRKEAFLQKYGTTNINEIFHSETITASIINQFGSLDNYYKLRVSQMNQARTNTTHEQLVDRLNEMGYDYINDGTRLCTIKCKRCYKTFNIPRQSININYRVNHFNFCPVCDYKNNTYRSNFEKSVLNEIQELLPGKVIQTNVHFGSYELDIYIPDLNFGIECNGLYWHSELYKDSKYHYEKKKFLEENFHLNIVYIWEDSWNYQHDIVIARLKAKLGLNKRIFARLCKVSEITPKQSRDFLKNYHIQGCVNSSINYGLFYNNELVQVITIGKSRKTISKQKGADYELYRMCSKPGITIVGGFSKLMKAYRMKYPNKVISFIDLSWSDLNGTGYKNSGFEIIGTSNIEYWWFNKKMRIPIRENRVNFQKHKLVNDGYNSKLTEVEIMHNRDYLKIYGPGNLIAII